MEVTATLARFIVDTRPERIPASMRHEAKRALVNILGCSIGSGRHATVERAVKALQPFFGSPQATLAGRRERCDGLHAAFINGIAAHVLDFDDTHPHAIHPSAPVWPALLAAAELHRVSGSALLDAFILGAEVELRIGNAVYPSHSEAGYHATGTCGVFGAAAACSRLLGLDAQRTSWALGIAATQASGLREMFGSDCKSLHPGKAARDGLTSALLAAKYFNSSERGIEAPRGFAHVLARSQDFGAIGDGLGERWELGSNMYKPFACGLVVHAAIDACVQVHDEYGLQPSEIAQVHVRVNPIVMELTAKTEPSTGLEGKFSIYHACAIALIRGRGGESEFSDAAVLEPEVVALRRKVEAHPDPAVAMMQAYATIRLVGGQVIEKHVPSALGSTERPMSDGDLDEKFRALVDGVLSPEQADALLNTCWHAEDCDDAVRIGRRIGMGSDRVFGANENGG